MRLLRWAIDWHEWGPFRVLPAGVACTILVFTGIRFI